MTAKAKGTKRRDPARCTLTCFARLTTPKTRAREASRLIAGLAYLLTFDGIDFAEVSCRARDEMASQVRTQNGKTPPAVAR